MTLTRKQPGSRPLVSASIDELERLFEEAQQDRDRLEALRDELRCRRTKRAKVLLERVHERLIPILIGALATRLGQESLPGTETAHEAPSPRNAEGPPTGPPSSASLAARRLEAWTALEVLSPQTYRRPEELVGGDPSRIARLGGEGELPWEAGGFGRHGKRLYYQVVLGELQLEPAYDALLAKYSEDAPERRSSKPCGVLAVVVCDRDGVPQPDAVAISSFAWGAPIALEGDLGRLRAWRSEEARLKRILAQRLDQRDEDGGPLPLDRATLERVFQWLTKELRLDPRWVKPPSFATREYQYLFLRDPPEPLLLNSFFLADLIRAQSLVEKGTAPDALRRYLAMLEPGERRDVLAEPTALQELLAPARTPRGRWPSRGRSSLVALQQAAVNAAMSSKPGEVVAVNGPPGTGKTTLLRDVVAAVVVERARVLASFEQPATAFQRSRVSFTREGERFTLHEVDARLRGFELVVASSNNKAVENVSAELPTLGAVADELPNLRYFASVATAIRGAPAWGLVAAVLGNKSNRYEFQKVFWQDPDDGLEAYLAAAAGKPCLVRDQDGTTRPPRVVEAERPPRGAEEALERWKAARRRFEEVLQSAESSILGLQRIHDQEFELPQRRARLRQLEKGQKDVRQRLEALRGERREREAVASASAKSFEELQAAEASHLAARPGFFARLFGAAAAVKWAAEHDRIRARLSEASVLASQANRAAAEGEEQVGEAERQLRELEVAAGVEREAIAKAERNPRAPLPTSEVVTGGMLVSLPHDERHRATAWFDPAVQKVRDDVFVAAMDLHRAFVDAAAAPLRQNLAGMMRQLWTGVPGVTPALVRDLWASLSLVVPLVSTTFASVENMLGALGPASIGWLLLDEAGQATPQSAVGAILRAERVVVVGDPMQIEPVVSLPGPLTHGICSRFGVSADADAAPSASVQTLADRASPYTGTFEGRSGTRTVGVPLLVHRRCAEPMFGISNAVAYADLMVSATPARRSRIGEALGPSRWFDVSGASKYLHWCAEEGEVLVELLARLAAAGVPPELYVISPFRAVAEHARMCIKAAPRLRKFLGDADQFVAERVGTVHTVQGREAEAVFLLLGAPEPRQQGARTWAGATPNILNVAVTRAQERLYVIGNRSLWRDAGCFGVLHDRLPVETTR